MLFGKYSHTIFKEMALCIEYAGFQVVAKVAKTLAFALVLLYAGKYASLSEWFVRKVSKFSWLLPNVGPVYPTFSAFAETFSPNRLAVWNIVRIFDPSNQKIVSLLE